YIAHIFDPVAGQASFRPVLEISNPGGAAFEFTVLDGVTVAVSSEVIPPFSGATQSVVIGGVECGTKWDGAPDASTSSTVPLPATTRIVVERSLDGDVWEDVLDTPGAASFMDWESWSYGDIQYRATAFTAEGAATVTEMTVQARSTAFWLSGGPGFGATCRLPHNPHVEVSAGRARDVKHYAGRSTPVVLA